MFSRDNADTLAGFDRAPQTLIGHLVRHRRCAGYFGSLVIVISLAACDAVGVPKTDDPAEKLSYARLLLSDDRALPAERLIGESMEIYRKNGDRGGLADAQYLYAKFLAGDAVELSESWYRENGFRDPSISFDKRREEAVRNFQLAASGFSMTGNFADAANAYFDQGLVQANDDDRAAACRSFGNSLENYYTYFEWDPKAETSVPANYDSYEDLVITVASASSCIGSRAADNRNAGNERTSELAEEAHALADILGPDRQAAIPGMTTLARRYEVQYRLDQAERNLRAAVELVIRSDGVDRNRTMIAMQDLTRFHIAQRQLAEAEALAREAANLGKTELGEEHRHTLESMANLATAIKLQRRPDEAEAIYRQALALSAEAWGNTDQTTLKRMRDLGFFYYGQGRYDEAETVYRDLLKGAISVHGNSSSHVLDLSEELANVLQGQGRLAEASSLREQILEQKRKNKINGH